MSRTAAETAMVDPITRQVIANRLESIPQEMAQIVMRTARSPIIVGGKDFSCGLLDAEAQLLATPEGSPVHVFPVIAEVRFIQEKFGNEIHPGDVFFANDFSEGGTHLNDVLLCTPLFHDDELVAFVATRGHLTDVGGMSPGSITGKAREIYQEGFRIPTVKLYERGRLVQALWETFLFNVRVPEQNAGDLQALLVGCRLGAKRLTETFDRYGKHTMLSAFEEMHAAAEQNMRAAIRELPDGTYTYEDYVDNDGVTEEPRMIRVAATVDGDQITLDLTGTAPQSQGPMNMGYGVSTGYSLCAVKIALEPGAQVKHGSFRPVRVVLPPGSMADAKPPAAVGSTGTTGALVAVGMAALAQILPKSVTAGENTTGNHFYFDGYVNRGATRERFVYYDYPAGGGGGRFGLDGIDATGSLRVGNVNCQPIEMLESAYSILRFTRAQLRAASGGPGQFRGGHGSIREVEICDDGVFSALGSQCMVPAGGLFGGYSGSPNGIKVIRGEEVFDLGGAPHWGKVTGFPIHRGDLIRMEMSGGGGYGDPLEREPARVSQETAQRLLTVAEARAFYGVVLETDTLAVDEDATRDERERLRALRLYLEVKIRGEPVYVTGVRRALCHPDLATPGMQEGTIVEIVSKAHPGPLRVRLTLSPGAPAGTVVIDEQAAAFFHLSGGAPVELRKMAGWWGGDH